MPWVLRDNGNNVVGVCGIKQNEPLPGEASSQIYYDAPPTDAVAWLKAQEPDAITTAANQIPVKVLAALVIRLSTQASNQQKAIAQTIIDDTAAKVLAAL